VTGQPDRARLRELLARPVRDWQYITAEVMPEVPALLDRLDELEAENERLRDSARDRWIDEIAGQQ